MSPNAKKDWNSWWKGREKDYENEIVLPVPSSDVYPAGIGGKEKRKEMKREVIIDIAQSYVSRLYEENEYPNDKREIEIDVEEAFIDGANWRINSVWHKDIQNGKTKKPILVKFDNGLFNLFEDIRDLKGIEDKVSIFAYIEDLLPIKEDNV